MRLPAEQIQPRQGTAWPTLHDLITARAEDGVDLHPGELLHADRQIAHVANSPDGLTITRLPADTLLSNATGIHPTPTPATPTPPTMPAATLHAEPAFAPTTNAGEITDPGGGHSPRRCATPDCPQAAQVAVVAAWPNERQEITERCRRCAGELTAARMDRSCAVYHVPLHAEPFPVAETPNARLGNDPVHPPTHDPAHSPMHDWSPTQDTPPPDAPEAAL